MTKIQKGHGRKRRRGSLPCEFGIFADSSTVDHRRHVLGVKSDTEVTNNGDAEALIASAVVFASADPADNYNRVCRPVHRHSSATLIRYCAYLVLMIAAFLIGMTLGQHHHQVNDASLASHHHINLHERDSNHTLPSTILVVGGAGFIGMHTALRLVSMGSKVISLDNINGNLYSPELKEERVRLLQEKGIKIIRGDACDINLVRDALGNNNVNGLVYLASQSGERGDGAVQKPFQYPFDNIDCFVSVLDALRSIESEEFIPLAYSSDTFGYKFNMTMPGALASDEVVEPSEEENMNKLRYNEMIARAYYKLYGISSVGLRFGTVVGPYGRPDMMYYNIADKMRSKADKKRKYSHIRDLVSVIVNELGTMQSGFKFASVGSDGSTSSADAIKDFTKWYKEAKTDQYVASLPPRRSDLTTSTSKAPTDICFVTSLFSNNPKLIEREGPYPIENYNKTDPSFRYYYFTNAHDLPSNGWEVIVMDDMDKSFSRYISQSRWPKFMGFRHYKLQGCKGIIYSDANRPPRDLGSDIWGDLVNQVLNSPSGIMQDKRPGRQTIFQEMHSIVERKKDIAANIDISKKWFLDQDDFHDNASGWWNMALIIDPSNVQLQELFTTLWAHYSNEEGSWRDQPLYRYLVDKLDVKPIPLPNGHSTYFDRVRSSGKHHHYNADTNGVSWT